MASIKYDDIQESRFADDLMAASKPAISDKDLTGAYKHFGVKTGTVKGKADKTLFNKASKDVLAWWNKKGKAAGFYQTTTEGTPLGRTKAKPLAGAAPPVFNESYRRQALVQYGLPQSTKIPKWATTSQANWQRWLSDHLRSQGIQI